MLWTILPKASARAWLGRTANSKEAVTMTAVRVLLVVVIGVLLLRGGLVFIFIFVFVSGRIGVVIFVFAFVMILIFIGDSEMSSEQTKFVDVNVAHDVDHRQLARFGDQDREACDVIALLHHVDLVMLARPPSVAFASPGPARRRQF